MAVRPVIALLGGGQLGRMFIENALRYDVQVHVLDPDPDCPCARIATHFTQGRFDDRDTVLRYAQDADVVGIEIEHVSTEALEQLQGLGKAVIPDPGTLRTIQDKGLQKQFYLDHGIPTEAFTLLDDGRDLVRYPALLPGFLKSCTGGYDGKGVMPVLGPEDAKRAFIGPCVLEKRSDIALELAVLVVRSANGEQAVYDPVEMVFDPRYNLVDHLRAPARMAHTVNEGAKHLALRVAEAFGTPGLYAVELFLTTDGRLLVNETAPRAHNSGHHTIEACASSQFDQLLRLYTGLPLGDTALRGHAAMINLVGEGGSGPADLMGLEEALRIPGTFLHLYGKKETRTGRKMGHITVMAADDTALDRAIALVKAHVHVRPRRAQVITSTNKPH